MAAASPELFCCHLSLSSPPRRVAASREVTLAFIALSYCITIPRELAKMNSPVIAKLLTFDYFPKNDLRRKQRCKRKEGRHRYAECSPAAVKGPTCFEVVTQG